MTEVTKVGLSLYEQMFDPALVLLVAKQALADRHGSVNELCRDRTVIVAVVAQFWHRGDQVRLTGRLRLSLRVVAVGAVFTRLVNIPGRCLGCLRQTVIGVKRSVVKFLGCRRLDPVEKEGQNITMFDLVATDEQYLKRDQQQQPN